MDSEFRELYQQVILDHNKNPKNFGHLSSCNHQSVGMNPLCGDHLKLELTISPEEVIDDIKFSGDGCAISRASASIMTSLVKGKNLEQVKEYFNQFHSMVMTDEELSEDIDERIAIFSGVKEFPARVKCATLSWHTLIAAIDGNESISTE